MAFKTSQAKFTSAKKYQTAVRLWAKATMLGLETGSLAAARCADRMLVAIRLMVVPSGTSKGKFWIDVVPTAQPAQCAMPTPSI